MENNRRKVAFREEALNALAQIDGDPTEIQAQSIYKLDCYACVLHDVSNPKSSNCRDNPYCINRLGLDKFDKLLKEEQKKADGVINNQTRRKNEELPCGLVNIGNFCYVNSFLQVFFNDPLFRQMVYDWRPIPTFVKPEGSTMDVQLVMNCLQKIFFHLEYTPFEDTTTFDFTDLLRLQNVQQDAQEFTIMFFDALGHRLMDHPNGKPFIAALKHRYYGKTKTRTWCKCGGRDNHEIQPFMSLQIPIDGFKTLIKAIDHHFAVETLHECRCQACGKQDQVCRQTEIEQLPDVLIIQLNRYINDMANGCQRKLRSAIAYPRTLQASSLCHSILPADDIEYELFAVMIHEGDNTHCGHYYDLVKHPYIDKWFKYNDNVVEVMAKPPGFEKGGRPNLAKPSSDMKACYGLLYRRKAIIQPCIPPAPEISEQWKKEFDTSFEKDTGAAITKSNNRVLEVKHRYTELNNVFENLKAHTDRYKNFKNLAFIPLTLLTDVLENEVAYAKKMLEEIAEDDQEPAVKAIRKLENGFPVKRGRGKGVRPAREEIAVMLKPTSMKLCPHGKASVESVIYGDVKVVSRNSAENLLSRYNFTVRRLSGSEERDGFLLTGKEICVECLKFMKDEAVFREQLESTSKMVQKVLKEKHRDSTSSKHEKLPGYLYVSKKCLLNFKKLAEQQWRYQNWKCDDQQLNFYPNTYKTVGQAASVPTETLNGNARSRKRKIRSGSEEPSTSYVLPDMQEEDDKAVNELVQTLVDNVSVDETEFTEEMRATSCDAKDSEQEQKETPEESLSSRPPTPPSVKPEEVVFNGLLTCPHGEVNISEFRYAVSPDEWAELIDYFPLCVPVACDDPICEECLHQEQMAQADQEERTQQKRHLSRQFGDFSRGLDRRIPDENELGTRYKYGICSHFVTAMRDAFKRSTDVFDLPPFCLVCLLCEHHNKPYKSVGKPPFSSEDAQIVAIQQKEWDQLKSQWPSDRQDELQPVRILPGGIVEDFCDECHSSYMEEKRLNNLVFEDQVIYIQLDDGTGAVEQKRGSSRRAAQKNIFKMKMSSSDKVLDLKVKLYTKTHATPKDQLLYNNEKLLDDTMTLFEAQIEPNNNDAPLRLHVNTFHPTITFNEDRELEMGFTGTALSY